MELLGNLGRSDTVLDSFEKLLPDVFFLYRKGTKGQKEFLHKAQLVRDTVLQYK